jgi:hypothetical protein
MRGHPAHPSAKLRFKWTLRSVDQVKTEQRSRRAGHDPGERFGPGWKRLPVPPLDRRQLSPAVVVTQLSEWGIDLADQSGRHHRRQE